MSLDPFEIEINAGKMPDYAFEASLIANQDSIGRILKK
jgi:hypothetical protein